jgi:hypothetical protein
MHSEALKEKGIQNEHQSKNHTFISFQSRGVRDGNRMYCPDCIEYRDTCAICNPAKYRPFLLSDRSYIGPPDTLKGFNNNLGVHI